MNQPNYFDQSNLPQKQPADIQPETPQQKTKWPVWVTVLIAILSVIIVGGISYAAYQYFAFEPDGEPVVCSMEYAPVCGVDGETYSNACFARVAKVKIDYKGKCQKETEPTACAEDAKICPDGSAVGRILPDCDFASCLEVVDSTAEIQAPCQNHPGPDFCPKGADDIIADGVDQNGCVIWACKNAINCAKEGETISGISSQSERGCCTGLVSIPLAHSIVDGTCDYAGGTFICSECGNGVCENIENICNCSEDCD